MVQSAVIGLAIFVPNKCSAIKSTRKAFILFSVICWKELMEIVGIVTDGVHSWFAVCSSGNTHTLTHTHQDITH